ncbi:hypothetical protein V7O66_06365 [Methanolobus sp. ZRKC3]|uniref:hypothetical protein n=1 Tax=Methanolobus sp. ZRKC3 TaxID=3125786 RepID=UPI00324AE9C6
MKQLSGNENGIVYFLKNVFISFIAFILIAILVTAILEDKIFFSVFVGIPAGIIAFLVTFIYLGYKDKAH